MRDRDTPKRALAPFGKEAYQKPTLKCGRAFERAQTRTNLSTGTRFKP